MAASATLLRRLLKGGPCPGKRDDEAEGGDDPAWLLVAWLFSLAVRCSPGALDCREMASASAMAPSEFDRVSSPLAMLLLLDASVAALGDMGGDPIIGGGIELDAAEGDTLPD